MIALGIINIRVQLDIKIESVPFLKQTTQGELWQLLCLGDRRSNVDAGQIKLKLKCKRKIMSANDLKIFESR